MTPRVGVIVLNWQKAAETIAVIDALKGATYPNVEIVVVDNASPDGSGAAIARARPDVTYLQSGANLGYAGGNNLGLRHALANGADYVVLLNPDVTLEPGFLEPLIEACRAHDDNAAVTPMVCEQERPDVIWGMGGHIDWRTATTRHLHHGERRADWQTRPPFEVDYALGVALGAPRRVWERVGLLEESYFLYYEETDWCVRARRAGVALLAVPGSCIWHESAAHGGRTAPYITYYMTRNALRFLRRNLPGRQSVGPILRSTMQSVWYATGDLRHGQAERARARLRGLRDFALGRSGPLS